MAHAAADGEALDRHRGGGVAGVGHAGGEEAHVVERAFDRERAKGLRGEGHAAGVGLHRERAELEADGTGERRPVDLRDGGLAQRIDRQPGDAGSVDLLEVAIDAHLAEQHATRVDGADIDQAITTHLAACGGESDARIGEAGPGGEVGIDEVRAASQWVRRGEVKLRGGRAGRRCS